MQLLCFEVDPTVTMDTAHFIADALKGTKFVVEHADPYPRSRCPFSVPDSSLPLMLTSIESIVLVACEYIPNVVEAATNSEERAGRC